MQNIIITGQLLDQKTIILDAPVNIKNQKIRITIEPIIDKKKNRNEVLDLIRKRQKERNYISRSKEEVDKSITLEKDSWE
ncbi:MAG: hypothetical protein H7A23_05515 [Leptospiraceae bacterium]|nr:hypothetical protein [Leptospiraceae bacterium]MCP5493995.1 hypothetical protein [Leptospiraceae bacterium]